MTDPCWAGNDGTLIGALAGAPFASILVIGYGNPLRGDDGVGPVVLEHLRRVAPSDRVEYLTCHQLTIELVEPVSRARLVLLIDAAAGDPPGVTACQIVTPEQGSAPTLLHYMTPGLLLAGGAALYGAVPPTLLWTITGASFGYDEGLSEPVQRAIPALVARLQACLAWALGK